MFYSITYYKADGQFAYVDKFTYKEVKSAFIHAALWIENHADQLRRADIIYQGKKVQKVVRSVAVLNQAPQHK